VKHSAEFEDAKTGAKHRTEAKTLSAQQMQQWQELGYLVLKQQIQQRHVQALNQRLNQLWLQRRSLRAAITIDAWLEEARSQRLLFSKAPNEARHSPYKLNDLYLEEPLVRAANLDPGLCRVLSELIDGEPLVCNSLNFEYGSQQSAHIDTLYMPPRKQNKLVVSWIALDAVDGSNGAVTYYPGSHLIPPFYFSTGKLNAVSAEMQNFHSYIGKELAARGIEEKTFHAEPGDVLIWHAQLLHGGSTITDRSKRRRSLVTHYFRREDYRHHFWRLQREHSTGSYIKRRHPGPTN